MRTQIFELFHERTVVAQIPGITTRQVVYLLVETFQTVHGMPAEFAR